MGDSEGGGCSNCASLQAQVNALQQQVVQLRRENEHLRQRIERLRQALQRARDVCQFYMQQTGAVLAHKSGIPRGQWAYAKGGYTVASRLWAILGQGEG